MTKIPTDISTVILAEQNETIRKSKTQLISLGTLEIKSYVVVVLIDEQGNISLTNVNPLTDLSFIEDEAKFMEGKFTIDVITVVGADIEKLPNVVLGYVKSNFPEVTNSKGNFDLRKISFSDDYSKGVLIDCSNIGEPPFLKQPTWKELRQYFLDIQTGIDPEKRIYEEQIRAFFPNKGLKKPRLIYSNCNWNKVESAIDLDDLKRFASKKSREELENECIKFCKEQNRELIELIKKDPIKYKLENEFMARNYAVTLPDLLGNYFQHIGI